VRAFLAIAEKAAEARREDNLKRALSHQLEMVERFRAVYPESMGNLFRLMFECHMAEAAIWDAGKDMPAGAERPNSIFQFTGHDPAHLRLQVISKGGVVLWQGDEHSDAASDRF
jgi:hypothetical protein